jgi:hypothetical protein
MCVYSKGAMKANALGDATFFWESDRLLRGVRSLLLDALQFRVRTIQVRFCADAAVPGGVVPWNAD